MDKMSPTLWVIDDDPVTRQWAAGHASSIGIHCGIFTTAERFLDSVDLSLPGCVVSELHLKGIMSGLELQTRLASLGSLIPLVMVSANLDVPTVVRAMQNGTLHVFAKPCETGLLTDAINAGHRFERHIAKARRTWMTVQSDFANLNSVRTPSHGHDRQ